MARARSCQEMAEWTGLEPATPGVTGRYSNQLNYHSACWWVLRGSNPRPSPCKGDALPAELSTPWQEARKSTRGVTAWLEPFSNGDRTYRDSAASVPAGMMRFMKSENSGTVNAGILEFQ